MHVLVTGGAGFIGSHVARALLADGHRVTVLDNLSSGKRHQVPEESRFIRYDITDQALSALFADVRPEAVIHCAAQVSVPQSWTNPLADLQQNVSGTVNLLEACRNAGTQSFVLASSAAVYGTPVALPVDEQHSTRPLSPYGLSKLAAEHYVQLLGEHYGLTWVILRYANVFGPGQLAGSDGAVVPGFLQAMAEGRDPIIHGDGEQTRDFVYVTDVSRANVKALYSGVKGVFQISTGVGTTINELWRVAAEATGWKRSPSHSASRPGDIRHSVLAPDLAHKHLTWSAQTGLREGLMITAAHWQYAAEVAATTDTTVSSPDK